jgi:hypothetical protein
MKGLLSLIEDGLIKYEQGMTPKGMHLGVMNSG